MDSRIAVSEREGFSNRLIAALAAAQEPITPTGFARAYNLRATGTQVTIHGCRKWMRGEAIPTQEKILVLANWLNVHPASLRFGTAHTDEQLPAPRASASLSTKDLVLMNDIASLPPVSQAVVRDLVDSLLRANAADGPGIARRPRREVVAR